MRKVLLAFAVEGQVSRGDERYLYNIVVEKKLYIISVGPGLGEPNELTELIEPG